MAVSSSNNSLDRHSQTDTQASPSSNRRRSTSHKNPEVVAAGKVILTCLKHRLFLLLFNVGLSIYVQLTGGYAMHKRHMQMISVQTGIAGFLQLASQDPDGPQHLRPCQGPPLHLDDAWQEDRDLVRGDRIRRQ